MRTPRETIFAALFALLQKASWPFDLNTTGRKLIDWNDVPDQPAMFLEQGPQMAERIQQGNTRWKLHAGVWVYYKNTDSSDDQDSYPDLLINQTVDAMEAALKQKDFIEGGKQTLGGLVTDCYIQGPVGWSDGVADKTGQTIIRVPIEILAV